MADLSSYADFFLSVFDHRNRSHELPPIAALSIDESYEVQRRVIEARQRRGEQLCGYKVGCTSRAVQAQLGIREPICGCLMSPFVHFGNTELAWSEFCQPAVEPEFVLRIGKDIVDEIADAEELEQSVDYVSPGIEVHHFRFWFGAPSIQELIASNGIHAALVVGDARVSPRHRRWGDVIVRLFRGGHPRASGKGHEIQGGPLQSLRWLANRLVRSGQSLKAGALVIPGSPVELVPVSVGERVVADLEGVGAVAATFRDR
jgi:2-keto-4-pentenoate hydratase